MANRDNISTGTSGSGTSSDWTTEDQYWRKNWSKRPYATADRGYDFYRPGYQYGYEAANRYRGREWNDVESDAAGRDGTASRTAARAPGST